MKSIVIIVSTFLLVVSSYFVFSNSIDLHRKMEKNMRPSICVDGVSYLIFPQGVTVQYLPNGSIKKCE